MLPRARRRSCPAQALPFGLVAGLPVQVSLVLNSLTNVSTRGGFVTGFAAAGNGQITATSVPEPASLLLTGTAVASLIVKQRRRRVDTNVGWRICRASV